MKNLAILLLALAFGSAGAGVVDLSEPTGGNPVAIVIAEPAERLGVVLIETKGYRELFAGYRFTAGTVNVTAYGGGEYLAGLGVKPRVRLVTSGFMGSFSLLSIIESRGHTGNYNKLVLGYTPIKWLTLSAVRLNGKNGPRVDFNLGAVNPYVEVTDRKPAAGMVIVF